MDQKPPTTRTARASSNRVFLLSLGALKAEYAVSAVAPTVTIPLVGVILPVFPNLPVDPKFTNWLLIDGSGAGGCSTKLKSTFPFLTGMLETPNSFIKLTFVHSSYFNGDRLIAPINPPIPNKTAFLFCFLLIFLLPINDL